MKTQERRQPRAAVRRVSGRIAGLRGQSRRRTASFPSRGSPSCGSEVLSSRAHVAAWTFALRAGECPMETGRLCQSSPRSGATPGSSWAKIGRPPGSSCAHHVEFSAANELLPAAQSYHVTDHPVRRIPPPIRLQHSRPCDEADAWRHACRWGGAAPSLAPAAGVGHATLSAVGLGSSGRKGWWARSSVHGVSRPLSRGPCTAVV